MNKSINREVAKKAAERVNFIKARGDINRYYSYINYNELVDLVYILQEYRKLCHLNNNNYEFEDEYNWIHGIVVMYYRQEEAHAGLI